MTTKPIKIKSHPDNPEQDMELFKNQQINNEITQASREEYIGSVSVLNDYLMQKDKGFYVYFEVSLAPANVLEVESKIKLMDNVVRHLLCQANL